MNWENHLEETTSLYRQRFQMIVDDGLRTKELEKLFANECSKRIDLENQLENSKRNLTSGPSSTRQVVPRNLFDELLRAVPTGIIQDDDDDEEKDYEDSMLIDDAIDEENVNIDLPLAGKQRREILQLDST